METLFQNILTAGFHGSIVIAAVILLRLVLKKTPRKYICMLWLLAGLVAIAGAFVSSFLLYPVLNKVLNKNN